MQISEIYIENFRAIRNLKVSLYNISALIGSNNCGKSTVLAAIDLFFSAAAKVDNDDFHNKDIDQNILISITFRNFTDSELQVFEKAIVDGQMTVTREFNRSETHNPNYSVSANVFKGFKEIRNANSASEKLKEYRAIQEELELPPVRSATDVEKSLEEWEKNNPNKLSLEQVRGFFGATNVANGKLKEKTVVRLIPAVRDVSDDTSRSKNSPVLTLLQDLARQAFENKQELQDFIAAANATAESLLNPANVKGLEDVGVGITTLLKSYYQDSSVEATWQKSEPITLNYPTAKIVVNDDGIQTDIEKVGHGLQRAILFSIVQFLAEKSESNSNVDSFSEAQSDIILLVEEPEIYQHPTKQLLLYENFRKITDSFNQSTGIRLQIVFTTHSEKLVQMRDFEICQIIQKRSDGSEVLNLSKSVFMEQCSSDLASYKEPPVEPMHPDAFATKLHIFTREINEGFFARKLILVEGETDKPVLEAYYKRIGRNTLSEGIQIVAVGGKNKLIIPAYIFSRIGIPTFVVFDNDQRRTGRNQQSGIQANRMLQKLFLKNEIVDFPTGSDRNLFAFDGNLECSLRSIVGLQSYNQNFELISQKYGLKVSEIKKSPDAFCTFMEFLDVEPEKFTDFDAIVKAVDEVSIFEN